MTTSQRAKVLLAGALALPALVILALSLLWAFSGQESRAQRRATEAAETLLQDSTARYEAEVMALRVLASSEALADGDFDLFHSRAVRISPMLPGWRRVVFIDRTGVVRIDTQPGTSSRTPTTGDLATARRDMAGCPCVIAGLRTQEGGLLLTFLDPAPYQPEVAEGLGDATVALVDREGRFVGRSRDAARRVGTPATEFVQEAVRRGGRGTYRGRTYEGLENYTSYVTDPATGWSAHVAMDRNLLDRPRFWVFVAIVGGALLSLMTAVAVVWWSARDIEARRREEAALMAMQRTEAIGRFASGIAHDFNNLLAVVIGNLDRIANRSTDPRSVQGAEAGLEAARRGARLVNQLLSFARGEGAEMAAVDVRDALTGMESLLDQAAGKSVAVEVRLPEAGLRVRANADQLESALVNLVVNARDALEGRSEPRVVVCAERRGDRVALIVEDNGSGVPPELRSRLFEPFVTTKPPGVGTGLGLAQVAGMAHQAGGEARLEDGESGGARFVVELPLADQPASTSVDMR